MKTNFKENKFLRFTSDFIRKKAPSLYKILRPLKVNIKYKKSYFREQLEQINNLSKSISSLNYSEWKKQEYFKLKGKKPNFAFIEINNSCNINCVMCDTKSSIRKKKLMKLDLFEQAVKKLKEDGINIVGLHTIGDPLANPKLPEIFKILRIYKMKTSISTNGLLIDRHLDTLKKAFDICPDIRFSIDGATKKTYENIRVGGDWDLLINNIELAVKELKPLGFRLSTNMTLTKENISEIGRFIVLFKKYFDQEYHNIQFNFMNSLSPNNNYFLHNNVIPNRTNPNYFCKYVAHAIPYILVNGEVSMCCRDYDGSLIMNENFTNTNDKISKTFEKENFKALQQFHEGKNSVKKFKLCSDCYEVDWRICEIFRKSTEYILYNKKNISADSYQKIFDDLIYILNNKNDIQSNLDLFLKKI